MSTATAVEEHISQILCITFVPVALYDFYFEEESKLAVAGSTADTEDSILPVKRGVL